MVTTNDDGGAQLAILDHFVESEAQTVAVAKAHPADARRQTLEGNALARHIEPVVQVVVVGHQLLHLRVGTIDVLRVTRERTPAEGADSLAKKRTNIGVDKAWEGKGVLKPFLQCHLADVVSVV